MVKRPHYLCYPVVEWNIVKAPNARVSRHAPAWRTRDLRIGLPAGVGRLSAALGTMRPLRQYTANSTARVSHIASVARDQVNVNVHA